MLSIRGVACLKLNVRDCGTVVDAFMHKILKREHLQIAQTLMIRRKSGRLIRVCAICHVKHILGNTG